MPARSGLLRARKEHEHSRVTYVELFFDLVFVFAITQLSQHPAPASDAAGRAAGNPVAHGRLVGVDRHVLVYELAQSG